jgi:hypothetical protein
MSWATTSRRERRRFARLGAPLPTDGVSACAVAFQLITQLLQPLGRIGVQECRMGAKRQGLSHVRPRRVAGGQLLTGSESSPILD